MFRSFYKYIFFFFAILSVIVLFGSVIGVFADTTSTNVSVGATVGSGASCGNGVIEGAEACDNGGSNGACPASCSSSCTNNSCGGGEPAGDTTSPSVTNIVATPSTLSAVVSWNATDNVSISSCAFEYGTTVAYGSNGTVSGSYQSSLSGLVASTQYFFRIRCSDPTGNVGEGTGTFTTNADVDITAPIISSVVTTTQITTAVISWSAADTSGVSSCSLSYGVTPAYGSSGSVVGAYQSSLSGLLPNTDYYCRISCIDTIGNNATKECNFKTNQDITPPPDVSTFVAVGDNTLNNLSWNYSDSISDFSYYRVEWALGSCPARGAGTLLQQITNSAQHTLQHTSLTNGTTYFYRISVYDTSGNGSAGVCTFATPSAAVCGNGIVNPGEQCDDGNSIQTDNCTNACQFAVCGDGIIRSGVEQCDSPQFNGQSCTTRGYDSGSLGCVACLFDETNCINAPITCGNGIVNPGEQCDDGNSIQTDNCTNACQFAVCGDGIIRSGVEQCDSPQFNGQSCTTLGFQGGSLLCSDSCTFNTSACDGLDIGGGGEICGNSFDDDSDGFIDCADSDCLGDVLCVNVSLCSDGKDNDGDGLIDLLDPGCLSISDNDEYNEPIPTVPEVSRISSLLYWIAERTISVTPNKGVVKSLSGDQLTVGVRQSDLYQVTSSTALTFVFLGSHYEMTLGSDGIYRIDVVVPEVGRYDATVEIFYQDDLTDAISFVLESAPHGFILDKDDDRISGAKVFLMDANGVLFDMTRFRQINPTQTDETGTYGFVVPNGLYSLIVEKDGYAQRKTLSFRVEDNIVNRSLSLILLPETVTESIAFALDVTSQLAQDVTGKVKDVADDPTVEVVTERVVAPTIAGVSAVSVAPSLFSIILPLLRFLFLQPLLIFGRKKRQAWGVVYNSLNKLPIDLATIRLIDVKTKKVVQSRVTDSKGRYLFMVEPGNYSIEVFKQGFVYPSKLLSDIHEDGRFVDIYHGEQIAAQDKESHITPNIPVDPVIATEKSIRRIVVEKWLRVAQYLISVLGILGTAISVYVFPSMLTVGFLILHVGLFVLFKVYIHPRKPKGWGLVYEENTKQPVGRVVARLFSKQFDKLVATQVTDGKGRYSFLVGPNDYYVTFEKTGFDSETTPPLSVKDEEGLVVQDVALKKGDMDKNK